MDTDTDDFREVYAPVPLARFDLSAPNPGGMTPDVLEGNYAPPVDDPEINEASLDPEEKESVADDDAHWLIGMYIGTAKVGFGPHFIFITSATNEDRCLWDDGQHSEVYATPCPRSNSPRFAVGVPYWFQTRRDFMANAPDGEKIHEISSHIQDIEIFRRKSEYPSPGIRVTFLGPSGKYIRCRPLETHKIQFYNDVVFTIFKDHQMVTSKGDFIVKLYGSSSGNAIFPPC